MEEQGRTMSCDVCGKVGELARTTGTWMLSGMPIATPETQGNRIALCRSCDHFKGQFCAKCGCFMMAKTRMATARCPVGKW
jgi:hypothetical protein